MSRGGLSQVRTVVGGLDHPEGVALGPDGALYAGGELGQIYRIDAAAGTADQIADTAGLALGICLDRAGAIYVCDSVHAALMRIPPGGGTAESYSESAQGTPIRTPNWAAFAADGSLWLSDSGSEDPRVVDGRLLHVPVGGGDAEVLEIEPLHFPNGLCLGLDGRVHWVESFTPRLRRLGLGGPELVTDLPGVVPDGVALDADGGFLIACYYPFRILRVPPRGGTYDTVLDDPLGQTLVMPTNVAFFGDGLCDAAVAMLGSREVKALTAPIPGAPLIYP
jgi:gluconolactonase